MLNLTLRRTLIAATAVLGLGVGVAGVAAADESPRPERAAQQTQSTPVVERQQGVVLEGTGSLDGNDVQVFVYDNDKYGSSVQVVLGEDIVGYAEQATPYVVDGQLDVTVDVDGRTVGLAGTVVPDGDPVKLRDQLQDAGEQHITKGTHTQLLADVRLTVGDTVVPLTFAPAFAFDLEVRKVDLYGH